MSGATARVAPDLLKALTIPQDTTVRRSAVDQEDLKQFHYLQVLTLVFIYKRLY